MPSSAIPSTLHVGGTWTRVGGERKKKRGKGREVARAQARVPYQCFYSSYLLYRRGGQGGKREMVKGCRRKAGAVSSSISYPPASILVAGHVGGTRRKRREKRREGGGRRGKEGGKSSREWPRAYLNTASSTHSSFGWSIGLVLRKKKNKKEERREAREGRKPLLEEREGNFSITCPRARRARGTGKEKGGGKGARERLAPENRFFSLQAFVQLYLGAVARLDGGNKKKKRENLLCGLGTVATSPGRRCADLLVSARRPAQERERKEKRKEEERRERADLPYPAAVTAEEGERGKRKGEGGEGAGRPGT